MILLPQNEAQSLYGLQRSAKRKRFPLSLYENITLFGCMLLGLFAKHLTCNNFQSMPVGF